VKKKSCKASKRIKKPLDCFYCGKTYASNYSRKFHEINNCAENPTKPFKSKAKQFSCCRCKTKFNNRTELESHRREAHFQNCLQALPWDDDGKPPWVRDDGTEDSDLKEVYMKHLVFILSPHIPGKVRTVYNFPTNDLEGGENELLSHISQILEIEESSVKIDISLGLILQNVEDKSYRYFAPNTNVKLLPQPVLISKREGLSNLKEKLKAINLTEYMKAQRPNTKYKVVYVPHLHIYTYKTLFTFGKLKVEEYIKNHHAIISLDVSERGVVYKDNLCIFRNLCMYFNEDVDHCVLKYYAKFKTYAESVGIEVLQKASRYKGVKMEHLFEIEKCFQIPINVFTMHENKSVTPIYLSQFCKEQKRNGGKCTTRRLVMNLNNDHLSFVQDFEMYAKKLSCAACERMFSKVSNYKRHIRLCSNRTKYVYPGGYHKKMKTIFQEMEEYGIYCSPDKQHYPWYSFYDFESMLVKNPTKYGKKLVFTCTHQPVSVSVCSNVEGYTQPFTLVNEEPDILITNFVDYLYDIQRKTVELAEARWSDVIEKLDELVMKWKLAETEEENELCEGERVSEDDFVECQELANFC